MTRYSKWLSLALAGLLLLSLLPAAAEGLTLTDMTGREVTLSGPADKVVVLMPADAEILYALGAGDKLVGRGEYCDYPADVLAVPSVQSGMQTNLEQIIALAPQALIITKMAQTPEQVETLEKAGIAVIVTDAQTIEGTYEAIRLIGAVVGKTEEADQLVAQMQEGFSAVAAKAAAIAQHKSVYFETSPLQWGLWTAGQGSFLQEIAQITGLKNVFDDIEGWKEISQEQVIARDPEVIVTFTMYFGEGPRPEEEIAARAGWQTLKAVTDQSIYAANGDELTRPGPRLVDGARELFEFVYGEKVEDKAA